MDNSAEGAEVIKGSSAYKAGSLLFRSGCCLGGFGKVDKGPWNFAVAELQAGGGLKHGMKDAARKPRRLGRVNSGNMVMLVSVGSKCVRQQRTEGGREV